MSLRGSVRVCYDLDGAVGAGGVSRASSNRAFLDALQRPGVRNGADDPDMAEPLGAMLDAHNRYPVWRERLRMCIPQIHLLRPTPSGELEAHDNIGTRWCGETDWAARPSSNTMFPALAGRPVTTRFATHVYCVWAAQPTRSPEDQRILLSRATDFGTTWDAPVVLSENEAPGASV